MRVGRNAAGASGYQEVSFECSTCGDREIRAVTEDPLRIDMVGWLASELRPPK
jgi:hypothetical protein